MKSWIEALLYLLFPRYCVVCDTILGKGEECLCTRCNIDLPRTGFHNIPDNEMEKLLWGRLYIGRATAFFYYTKGSGFGKILHHLKYRGEKEIGKIMGAHLATEIIDSGFFDSVDLIVPVPLHKKRKAQRGYNQSEYISRGISKVTGIPIDTGLIVRRKNTVSQTRKSVFGRTENMEDAFSYDGSCAGKHILIVDDVITTGATIASCAAALQQAGCDRISVVTLAIAVT